MATRLGVDVGGTFSDLVVYDDETGEVWVAKGATTPASPDEGVARVVSEAVSAPVLQRSAFFLHGSTVGLNALLERRGARVGLLTTEGFRDVLELRRGDRPGHGRSLLWRPADPIVPRHLRFGVKERVLADGTIEQPLDGADVERALEAFTAEGVECIAIVFINGYANGAHELEAEQILREAGFDGDISVSHRVSGEYYEYERTSTTVIDAYIRPRMSAYLKQLESSLRDLGMAGSCMITNSGGGAMPFSEAEARPFTTIMSGPVAGAVGAGELCRVLELETAVTADVGGTSFDTCLIRDGRPDVRYEGTVEGMPLQTPWVDVRSIGAGGGSIAFVDDGGLLRVGLRSAGAEPGPVCYSRGGTEPTTTDAAAVLGMLGFGRLAGGLSLDIDAARKALEPLGERLGLDAAGVARGIMAIVSASMANAIREVTIEQGQDPRDAALLAFGGAGPLFGTLLASELEIKQIVVPAHAGNFSAWGLLAQDITHTTSQTLIASLDADGLAAASEVSDALFARLHGTDDAEGIGKPVNEAAVDMRFVGQEYTLTIPVELDGTRLVSDPDQLQASFTSEYERVFGHALEAPVEIVSVRATLRMALPRRSEKTIADPDADAAPETRGGWSFTRDEEVDFAVVRRSSLKPGGPLAGPAIVVEPTTTTYVDDGFEAEIHPSGAMIVTDRRA